jgi:hypothetical protein
VGQFVVKADIDTNLVRVAATQPFKKIMVMRVDRSERHGQRNIDQEDSFLRVDIF